MSRRLDQEREQRQQPERMAYAMKKLQELGFDPWKVNETCLQFYHQGAKIFFYPYSGWHSGKLIKDGRGLENLLKQLK